MLSCLFGASCLYNLLLFNIVSGAVHETKCSKDNIEFFNLVNYVPDNGYLILGNTKTSKSSVLQFCHQPLGATSCRLQFMKSY